MKISKSPKVFQKIIKWTTILTFLTGVSFMLSFLIPKQEEKKNTYIFDEQTMVNFYQSAPYLRQALLSSDQPTNRTVSVISLIDSIQKSIEIQYKTFHPDTTKPKK